MPDDSDLENIDLYDQVYKLLQQIPKGYVSTYGAIAKALGDIKASRAVGTILSQNEHSDIYPCYKIVYSTGEVGNFTHPLGPEEKKRRLRDDGIKITKNRIDNFEEILFTDFKTESPLKKLATVQESMKDQININDEFKDSYFGAIDVSYSGRMGYGAFLWYNGQKIEKKEVVLSSDFPYIPGYLAFKEMKFIRNLCSEFEGILLVDANGLLHPRMMGLATYAGLKLDIPTIGVAKSLQLGKVKGNSIYLGDKETAIMLSKRCIVSPGNRVSLKTAIDLLKPEMHRNYPKILKLVHDATVTLRRRFETMEN